MIVVVGVNHFYFSMKYWLCVKWYLILNHIRSHIWSWNSIINKRGPLCYWVWWKTRRNKAISKSNCSLNIVQRVKVKWTISHSCILRLAKPNMVGCCICLISFCTIPSNILKNHITSSVSFWIITSWRKYKACVCNI